MWRRSRRLQEFMKHGFGICCFAAGFGSLVCTYLAFPSPETSHKRLFHVSSVGFFIFTVIGYLHGPDSISRLKIAAFRLALVFSSSGLGLCGWLWRWSETLLLLLTLVTCLFQVMCVEFQLKGKHVQAHASLTLLLPGVGAVYRNSEHHHWIKQLQGSEDLDHIRRLKDIDMADEGTRWAIGLIVTAVCVILTTGAIAGWKLFCNGSSAVSNDAGKAALPQQQHQQPGQPGSQASWRHQQGQQPSPTPVSPQQQQPAATVIGNADSQSSCLAPGNETSKLASLQASVTPSDCRVDCPSRPTKMFDYWSGPTSQRGHASFTACCFRCISRATRKCKW
eukprot:TRINITY_DN61967_c0_g1_i1.p1 TRINITY_DN61967_c0_g1~~TRINITY_DN61967_c0_g1_i1.p1  ORF type:complete len:336 (+),score=38.76 TRINITY_DN61967_c0_g1_i1:270-1277(+)